MSDKEKGTVKFFNDKKGYGFITKEDGTDVFVHFSSIVSENDFKTLKQDQAVEFEVEKPFDGHPQGVPAPSLLLLVVT